MGGPNPGTKPRLQHAVCSNSYNDELERGDNFDHTESPETTTESPEEPTMILPLMPRGILIYTKAFPQKEEEASSPRLPAKRR